MAGYRLSEPPGPRPFSASAPARALEPYEALSRYIDRSWNDEEVSRSATSMKEGMGWRLSNRRRLVQPEKRMTRNVDRIAMKMPVLSAVIYSNSHHELDEDGEAHLR